MPTVSISFKWYDLWVGAYIDRQYRWFDHLIDTTVYICLVPTVVLKLQFPPRPLKIRRKHL